MAVTNFVGGALRLKASLQATNALMQTGAGMIGHFWASV